MIVVRANGREIRGWESVSVKKSIDQISASFSLSMTPSDGNSISVPVFPGDTVQIFIDSDLVILGYADSLSPSFSSGSHSVSLSGREITCDMVDSCLESPSEWKKKKADEIIRNICESYGLTFSKGDVDCGSVFDTFSSEPGEKAFDVVNKICKSRYIVPFSDGCGNVSLFDIGRARHGDRLVQGVNVLSGSAKLSVGDRFYQYSVFGTGKPAKKVSCELTDEEIKNRPRRRFALVDSNALTQDQVNARAEWELRIRAAKAAAFSVTVHGWRMSDGNLWSPGTICALRSPAIGLSDDVELIIDSVAFQYGNSGEEVSLSLVDQDVFSPCPVTERIKSKKVKKTTLVNDPWKQVKKEIAAHENKGK